MAQSETREFICGTALMDLHKDDPNFFMRLMYINTDGSIFNEDYYPCGDKVITHTTPAPDAKS